MASSSTTGVGDEGKPRRNAVASSSTLGVVDEGKPHRDAAAWSFHVFVIERTAPHSERALADLRRVLDHRLPGGYHLEVTDLREHPELAIKEQLIIIPAVIRKLPEPQVRLAGSFADEARVAEAFGLDSPPPRRGHVTETDADG